MSNQVVFDKVSKGFKNNLILDNISFTVNHQEFVSIVGPYGAGKTTILKILSGLLKIDEGTVNIFGLTPDILRQKRAIGYTFQRPCLLPWKNVTKNLELPLEIAQIKDKRRVTSLLKMLDLFKYKDHLISELSGGTQQLVSILQALVLNPTILLLDEPFSSIDELTRFKMQRNLLNLHNTTKKTTLMITHSLSEAVFLSDRIIVISSQPSYVKKSVVINLKNRNDDIRYTRKFQSYVKQLRTLLIND